jgi:hypothetical protein
MTIKKRDKLPDIEAKTNYFIPRVPTTFERAFPQIATMRFEVERGQEMNRLSRPTVYTDKSPPERVLPCDNPRCYGGGCDVQRCLSGIVAAHETEVEETLFCEGYVTLQNKWRKISHAIWRTLRVWTSYPGSRSELLRLGNPGPDSQQRGREGRLEPYLELSA